MEGTAEEGFSVWPIHTERLSDASLSRQSSTDLLISSSVQLSTPAVNVYLHFSASSAE